MVEFSRNKRGKYGARSECKECMAKYNKKYYQEHGEEIAKYNQEHREEIAKYKKQYRQEHKEEIAKYYQEHREEIAKYKKQYYQNNKEEIAKYNQEHREEIAKYKKQYYQNNKEEIANLHKQYNQTPQGKESQRKGKQKYRASKNKSFYQSFTQQDKELCLNYFNYKCPYTGKQLTDSETNIDHIVPLSDKDGIGATAPWNLIICDASANRRKNNKPILEFINTLPNVDEVYNRIREYIILQAKRYIDIIPEDDVTLKTFNITFEELENSF